MVDSTRTPLTPITGSSITTSTTSAAAAAVAGTGTTCGSAGLWRQLGRDRLDFTEICNDRNWNTPIVQFP